MTRCAAAAAAAVVLLGAGAAHAAVDLSSDAHLRLDGPTTFARAGTAVASGDVNGDGVEDLIVGAPQASTNGSQSGSVSVVFGPIPQGTIDLASLGQRGFQIDGGGDFHRAGMSVANAGDVNGDGRDDIVVGVPGSNVQSFAWQSDAYVVFGKPTTARVNLGRLAPSQGFAMLSEGTNGVGGAVAGAGDVNGDGLDDVIVGADGLFVAGGAYVVFGKRDGSAVQLESLGSAGFEIRDMRPTQHGASTGHAVAGGGDVNGDGLADLLLGSPAGLGVGQVFVVFGKADSGMVDLNALGGRGYYAAGGPFDLEVGWSVAHAGDQNRDGLADLVVGAPLTQSTAGRYAGAAYVVFGKAGDAPVQLAEVTLGRGGFAIHGAAADDQAGRSVGILDDLSGDGLPEILVGATWADPNGRSRAGSVYAVSGRPTASPLQLALIETAGLGFRIDGAAAGHVAGASLAQTGDVNVDGRADVLLGAPGAEYARQASGSAYVAASP